MDLSIQALKAAGAFSPPPIKKDIVWHSAGKAQKATIYIRQESFVELTERWKEQDKGGDFLATRIAANVLKKDGTPVFTVEDVVGSEASGHGPLSAELTIVLLNAISEANGAGPADKPKKIGPAEEFWHELVLNGIGGRTIAEAKANLTYNETLSWMAYFEQSGTANLGLRMERGFALLATILNNVHGGKANFDDFLPKRGEPEEGVEASAQDLFALLQSVKR